MPSSPPPPAQPAPTGPDGEPLAPKMSSTYNEDVVQISHTDGSLSQAVVTRCWADEQAPEAVAEAERLGIPFVPLTPGYLEVLHPDGTRTQVLEASVEVVDKGFLRSDIVRKRRPAGTNPSAKSQVGQIVGLETQVQLERVLTGEKLDGWHNADDLVAAARLNRGDHVVEPDSGWVGIVEEVFEMAMIEAGNAGLVRRVCDTGTTLSVGNATEAIKQMLQERGESLLASFLGASDLKQILDVKQCMIAVNWLCRNQQATTHDWQRPRRYWTEIDKLVLVRATADHLHTIHDKVVFRDPAAHPAPASRWSDAYPEGHRVLAITACRTTATVLWQDGTRTTAPTPEFEQAPSVDDETDVFPGDLGVFSGVSPARIGVVQAMDARKRTIRMRYLSDRATPLDPPEDDEVVSGLEFDPHGPPPDAYGVRRGDFVLVVGEGQDNGAKVPTVPSLGESEIHAGLMPGGEDLRMELSALGLSYCQTLSDAFVPPKPQASPEALAPITWYGEVWDLQLDGSALIRFPSGETQSFPVSRLVHLDDGMDPDAAAGELPPLGDEDEAMLSDEASDASWLTEDEDADMSDAGSAAAAGEAVDILLDGEEAEDDSEDEDYRTEDEGAGTGAGAAPRRSKRRREKRDDEDMRGWADEDDEEEAGKAAAEEAAPAAAPAAVAPTSDAEVEADLLPSRTEVAEASASAAPAAANGTTATAVSMPGEIEDFADWSRFEVLEEAPFDHHYIGEPVQVPTKAFMSRMRKEHQVLASSLPPNILVRAYENRLDLLRCLIIGPLDTPFQNAPFLFDVFLSPAKFPQEPPQVFFHSWASGTRVSPNLYVEGKVCLSLLGTWSGDKDENWSAAKSSILQVFISIQGLIMVEEPYFTEPGFEKQIGTPEATAASELYNERTLVLTRAFVKRACEYPPSSFTREIAAYFFTGLPGSENGGALGAIIDQSKKLLDESERWHAQQDDSTAAEDVKPPKSSVVPSQRVLTEGAGLSLRRTVKALEELMKRGPKLDAAAPADA
ncbi:ubiquitin-conjugating enzyme E2 [Rhodotorula paludigena]|uniref:ubiquitin-conjugating enzyme E2 n=1 Tax=Rhodotorula paludigena TaxID=86838 RepID=UPI0031811FDC